MKVEKLISGGDILIFLIWIFLWIQFLRTGDTEWIWLVIAYDAVFTLGLFLRAYVYQMR